MNEIRLFDPDEIIKQFDPSNRINQYLELLAKENTRINLVSRETAVGGLVGTRDLTAESLLPLIVLQNQQFSEYLDIGSGGGIPAIPLILSQRISKATFSERTQKKAAALRRIVNSLDLQVEIYADSFQQLKLAKKFDLITMRLVKLDRKLLSGIMGMLAEDGHFVHYAKPIVERDLNVVCIELYSFVNQIDKSITNFTIYRNRL